MTAALANAVLDVLLGEYIEGLDQRQLELDVLNGHLLLQNLTIRSTAIQRALQLPVAVKAGIIGRVELRIPWAHLSSQPTQLRMRNLLLLVGPQSEAHWDRDEEERNALERKRATLLAHEESSESRMVKLGFEWAHCCYFPNLLLHSIHESFHRAKVQKKGKQAPVGMADASVSRLADTRVRSPWTRAEAFPIDAVNKLAPKKVS